MELKARVSYKEYRDTEAVVIEIRDTVDGTWGMSSAFPKENFKKDGKLAARLIQELARVQDMGYEIKFL